jgi:hypothetical protein
VALGVLARVLEALDARLLTKVVWRGGELDRLLDADHSALQEAWSRRKARAGGWISRQEVTYNIYGERGSIDDLAYHPATRALVVSELKTESTTRRRRSRKWIRRSGWRVRSRCASAGRSIEWCRASSSRRHGRTVVASMPLRHCSPASAPGTEAPPRGFAIPRERLVV